MNLKHIHNKLEITLYRTYTTLLYIQNIYNIQDCTFDKKCFINQILKKFVMDMWNYSGRKGS